MLRGMTAKTAMLRPLRVMLLLALVLPYAAQSWGQAPAAGTTDATFARLTFFAVDQWSFVTHPYFQITSDTDFKGGRAAAGGSLTVGPAATDVNSGLLTKALHGMPSFGFEWGRGTEIFLPKAFSIGFDYYHFYQFDTNAASSGTVPPIATDTYLYNASLRFFAFDPTKPGINYFVGIGVGILDGTMRAKPFTGQSAEFIHYSQNPFGTTRLGLEAKGDNLGFRYELLLVNADRVNLDKNPYTGAAPKTIDFSGVIIRLALFWEFGQQ